MSKEKSNKVYLTTTLPYVNSDPHIGFALEIIHADIIARYFKLIGKEVFFNTGTDEHGSKVYRKAQEEKKDTQTYVDEYAERFKGLIEPLGLIKDINFIRTTDEFHKKAAQAFWMKCKEAGDIYKKNYKIKYCVGCELEKTDSELVDGKCPIHPHLELEIIEEENYFFKLSKYSDYLLKLYERTDFVIPDSRLNELRTLIKEKGLEDFSISRLKEKMPWGVQVPDDENHVMYVWFDAFINYISAIGWPHDMDSFNKWWNKTGGVIQFAGKDQVRQQAAMWQAMLASVGILASKQIIIHGFIQSGGQKMSKSLGNVISPYDIVNEYGVDALRYFIARDISFFEDSDVTHERLKESYNANLANGLGNLTSRILKMAISNGITINTEKNKTATFENDSFLEAYDVKGYCNKIWDEISILDKYIQDEAPFKTIKVDKEKGGEQIKKLLTGLYEIAERLQPVLPTTSEKILQLIKEDKMPEAPLFVRKD